MTNWFHQVVALGPLVEGAIEAEGAIDREAGGEEISAVIGATSPEIAETAAREMGKPQGREKIARETPARAKAKSLRRRPHGARPDRACRMRRLFRGL